MNIKDIFEPILGADGVLTEAHDCAHYGQDWCKEFTGKPACIVLPRTIQQVVEVVHCCRSHKLKIVPSGGRTGLSGGATASNGEVVLSLERMNQILDFDEVGLTLRCQSGATLEAVRSFARERGFYYPIDIASKGSCQIGGTVATNAGGIRVIRYGCTRDWVLGLTVVTGSGEILHCNGALLKNQSGFDLRSLMIGSEGALGVIVEVTLKLTTAPPAALLALLAIEHAGTALELLKLLRSKGFIIQVFEYFEDNALSVVLDSNQSLKYPFSSRMPAYLLVEVEHIEPGTPDSFNSFLYELLQMDVVKEVAVASTEKQYMNLMGLRENISESISKRFFPHKNDISVPISVIPAFLDALKVVLNENMPNCEYIIFGHFGDGNLHINLLKPSTVPVDVFIQQAHLADHAVFKLISSYGGSISAEHGVGLLKKDYLTYTRAKEDIEIMRAIKRVFDLDGVLNPGKIFD